MNLAAAAADLRNDDALPPLTADALLPVAQGGPDGAELDLADRVDTERALGADHAVLTDGFGLFLDVVHPTGFRHGSILRLTEVGR